MKVVHLARIKLCKGINTPANQVAALKLAKAWVEVK